MGFKQASDRDVAIYAVLFTIATGLLAIFVFFLVADLFEPRAAAAVCAGVVVGFCLDMMFLGLAIYYALAMRMEAAIKAAQQQTPPPAPTKVPDIGHEHV